MPAILAFILLCLVLPVTSESAERPLFPDLALRWHVGDAASRNPISITEGPKTLGTADFNGDDLADVVAGNLDGSISVLLGNATNGLSPQILTPATNLLASSSLRAVAISDFNSDGRLDIAVGDIAGSAIILLVGDGTGRF